MSIPKFSLHGDITPDQSPIQVRLRFQIDDEIFYLLGSDDVPARPASSRWSFRTMTSTPIPAQDAFFWAHVVRARQGTVAAEHAEGAEIIWLDHT